MPPQSSKSGAWSTVQEDWQSPLQGDAWGKGRDNVHLMRRLWSLPADVIAEGPPGRVLDVAAAQAVHASKIANRGFPCIALEPAPTMLADARKQIAEANADVVLVRGIAEHLPFSDRSFDQVICHSAIDHFAEPDRCIREMTRVLRLDGRLVLTFVNYGGVGVRLSRMFYRLDGLFRRTPRIPHWFWESPVPHEHSFECTLPVVSEMCEQYLTFESAFGISIGWQMPGWGWLLEQFEVERANSIVSRLDRLAHRFPSAADVIVAVWKPTPRESWKPVIPQTVGWNGASKHPTSAQTLRVTSADPVYRRLARDEIAYRPTWVNLPEFAPLLEGLSRMSNREITGSAERSWMDDLLERASPGRVAVLGLDGTDKLIDWQRARAGESIDVFDLSEKSLQNARRSLADAGLERGARFIPADLNFLSLPTRHYDIVWSSGCLHHVINLERLLDEIAQSLRDGGVLALHDYVGECRRQFSDERISPITDLLAKIPAHLRRDPTGTVKAPEPSSLSPFCAVRSEEIPLLVHERFETTHESATGYLFPIELYLDLNRIEKEAPDLIARLLQSEADARHRSAVNPTTLYGSTVRDPALDPNQPGQWEWPRIIVAWPRT
jgi:ubiquinone/menaquinone biosynthesis C-methylase UbiE